MKQCVKVHKTQCTYEEYNIGKYKRKVHKTQVHKKNLSACQVVSNTFPIL